MVLHNMKQIRQHLTKYAGKDFKCITERCKGWASKKYFVDDKLVISQTQFISEPCIVVGY